MKAFKRILITGCTGFIGKNLIDGLVGKYQIVCIVRDTSYKRDDIKVIYGSILDENCVNSAMQNIDIIVHLAAILNPFDKNIEKVNVDSTRLLIDAAKRHNVRKFIFVSTENVLYNFDDAYSKTKRKAEILVRSFSNYLILRPTVVYGRHDKRYIKSLVDIVKKYKIAFVPDSKKLFQPVYVEDVEKCIENGLKYDVKGEYIVAGPSKITYRDFVDAILDELGIKRKFIISIPLPVLKLVNYMNSKFFGIGKIRIIQIESLEIDKIYDIRKTTKDLKYKPTPFKAGLKFLKLFKSYN